MGKRSEEGEPKEGRKLWLELPSLIHSIVRRFQSSEKKNYYAEVHGKKGFYREDRHKGRN